MRFSDSNDVGSATIRQCRMQECGLLVSRKSGGDAFRLRSGLLIAVLALSGCVSATADMSVQDSVPSVETAAEGPEQIEQPEHVAAVSGYRDPMVTVAGAGAGRTGSAAPAMPAPPANLADAIMQPAQLNAHAASIYAPASSSGAAPAAAPQNAAFSNLYRVDAAGMPLEDGAETTGSIPPTGARRPVPGSDNEASLVPSRVPLPTSARTAMFAEADAEAAPQAFNAAISGMPGGGAPQRAPAGDLDKTLTLAALFAAKRKADPAQGAVPKNAAKPILNRHTAAAAQLASLGTTVMPEAEFAPQDHSEAEEDAPHDQAAGNGVTEVASLAGLARLSPNGLWLQTEKVETGCFKPQLLDVLKTVEKHYGKPVIVTSGVRQVKRGRSRQSLHTSCEAADIQIAGVSRWELAEYLRAMPGRGGVGTYCHTESVHIDIGPERDWNWQCRAQRK